MSSIRSTLIRSTISKLQGELEQLENWLNRDYSATAATTSVASTDGSIIYHAIQQLSKQMDSQQHTLNHIIDRLDVLEGTRNIHIEDPTNPWIDAEVTQLHNEIIDDLDNEYDTIINVNKSEEPMVSEPAVIALEPVVVEPVVIAVVQEVQEVQKEEVQEEEVQEEEVQKEEVQEEEVQEEEEEEEEEEMEYEEVNFKGETFYRDTQQFIFRMDEEGQLSEDPIGYWKVKTQTIIFYQK